MVDNRGMTLPEVLIAVAILTVGLLAVVSMLSAGFSNVIVGGGQSKATSYGRQKVEELRNQPFVATLAQQTDAPETGVTRTWQIAQVGATATPNRLARITVVVTWTGGSTGGQQVTLETMRSE
jgi:prepilin-type N-terminal cleavage/methylation domain-containing protein